MDFMWRMNVFKQPLWMIPFGHYIGNISIILGLYLVITQQISPYYLILWLVFHFFGSLMLSVGLHRYFSHGTFVTSNLWHKIMAYYSVLLLNGSPLGWATAHNTHHLHSDKEGDPHYADWKYLYNKRYRNVPMLKQRLKVLSKDPTLAFVHRYGALLWIVFSVVLLSISWKLYLFAYLMPLGSTHMIGAIHQITSHKNKTPRNLPWLELIFPACGEWNHKTHHDHPGRYDFRTRWYHLDMGAMFINLIKR